MFSTCQTKRFMKYGAQYLTIVSLTEATRARYQRIPSVYLTFHQTASVYLIAYLTYTWRIPNCITKALKYT